MGKGEISWKGKDDFGLRREVYAHKVGTEWQFFVREKRFDEWERLTAPLLDDYLELLDGVRRRIARRLVRPEEEARVVKLIRESYPEAEV